MARVPFTDAETNLDKPIRSAFGKKIKDNDDDHESRILAVEGIGASAIFDHFDWIDRVSGAPNIAKWKVLLAQDAAVAINADHFVRLSTPSVSADAEARIASLLRFRPDQLPVYKAKIRNSASANIKFLLVGLGTERTILTQNPSNGIYLRKVTGADTNTVFVTRKGGSEDVSSAFLIPANGTWYEVEIRYLDSDSVECFLDGTSKAIFNGPADFVPDAHAETMLAEVNSVSAFGNSLDIDVDRIKATNTTVVDLT